MNAKICALRTYVWSVLIYGCECWELNKDEGKQIDDAKMGFLRCILKYPMEK